MASEQKNPNLLINYSTLDRMKLPFECLLDFAGPLTEISSPGQNKVSSLFISCHGYFSADLKSFLSHSSNMHFHITRCSLAFLKKKVIFLCKAMDQLKILEWRHCGGERKIAR
jgi:hypothetical protein